MDWFMVSYFIFMSSYFIVITLVFISSSLWKLYYCLELQWMMILLFFIIAYSIYKGLFHFLIINLFVSILVVFGFIFISIISTIIGCYGKLGYFPFIVISLLIYNSCSFIFMIYDYLNKTVYFIIVNNIININLLYYGIDYVIILFSLLCYYFIFYYLIVIKVLLFSISYYIIILLLILFSFNIILLSFTYYFIYYSFILSFLSFI